MATVSTVRVLWLAKGETLRLKKKVDSTNAAAVEAAVKVALPDAPWAETVWPNTALKIYTKDGKTKLAEFRW